MSNFVIEDAASAVAASKCWLHRSAPIKVNAERLSHPGECGWCAYPAEVLVKAVSEFMTDCPNLVDAFERLPLATQRTMVLRAQGMEVAPPKRTSRLREQEQELVF